MRLCPKKEKHKGLSVGLLWVTGSNNTAGLSHARATTSGQLKGSLAVCASDLGFQRVKCVRARVRQTQVQILARLLG